VKLICFRAVPPLCQPSGAVPLLRSWGSECRLSTKSTFTTRKGSVCLGAEVIEQNMRIVPPPP